MDDLISRRAALDEVRSYYDFENIVTDPKSIEERIEDLPSAQPERKTGRWIVKGNPGTGWYRVTCSECDEDVTSEVPMIGFPPNGKILWDYCPYCGAKMEGEEND